MACIIKWLLKIINPKYWLYLRILYPSQIKTILHLCKKDPHLPTSTIILDTWIIWQNHPRIVQDLIQLYLQLNKISPQYKRITIRDYQKRFQQVEDYLKRMQAPPILNKAYLHYLILRQLLDDIKDINIDKQKGKITLPLLLFLKDTSTKQEIEQYFKKLESFLKNKNLPISVSKLLKKYYWLTERSIKIIFPK